MERLPKELLGLAGEYAVASKLCRLRLYVQLTLGHHKRTDILVESSTTMFRIQVKAKQANEWPGVSGLWSDDEFLVLVDLKGKSLAEPPDFYVLDLADWERLILEEQKKSPGIQIDEKNRITYPDGWKGLNIRPSHVAEAKDQWHKITSKLLS